MTSVLLVICPSSGCSDDPTTAPAPQPTEPSAALKRLQDAIPRFRERKPLNGYETPRELASAIQAIQRLDYGSANSLLEERLKQKPGDPHAIYFRGFLNHRQKLYAAARPDFEKVLEAGPVFPSASGVFIYYGWCCYYLADLDAAAASFQAAFDLDIDRADSTYGLGMIAFDRGELDAAQAAFEKSAGLFEEKQHKKGKPTQSDFVDLAKSHARLGSVFLRKADLAADESQAKTFLGQARAQLEDATRLIPFSEETWFNLSRVYAKLGETELENKALAKRDEIKARQAKPEQKAADEKKDG